VPETAREPFRGPLTAALEARLGLTAELTEGDLAPLLAAPDAALPVPGAIDRAAWDAIDPATHDTVLTRVAAELDAPWPVPLASDAARFHRAGDGDRERWETPAFARQHRLSRTAFAAALTAEDRHLDTVADGVWMLCEQSSWCWPAHDDTLAAHGSVLATVDDPFLDLGAGEAVGQLAWLDHLLGASLDERYPGIRARIRREARVRVIEPFLRRRHWHWLGLDGDVHNWNPWIHGNVLVAALQLLEPGAERTRVVRLVIEGLDRYLAVLPDDGAIDEGYGYWWNGACRALEALDVLAAATGGVAEVRGDIPSLVATVAFPHRCHLGGDWYLNLADGQARPDGDQPWHALHRAARAVADDAARAHAAAHRIPDSPAVDERHGLGRMLRGATDAAWVAAERERSPLPREVWLGSIELLLARETEGSAAGLTMAVKGGHNGEHHNHDDVGSFVVASDGVPVLVDAGRPTYTAATFGAERGGIWTMQSSWHNVPEVRGTRQGTGAAFRAQGTTASADAGGARFATELAGAYPDEGLRGWQRTVTLERGTHPRVVVDDAWQFDDAAADAPTALHLLVAGDVELGRDGARVTPLDGATPVRLHWPPGLAAATTVRELDDPMLSRVWGARLTRIELDVTRHTQARVTVELDTTTPEDPYA
jgi:hypothetical protein